ncbi:MAG: helix-turn-helix transcriptional regulator [Aestuariivirgaceae bacterium]
MTSFQITVSPHRRAAARFIALVRRELQKALLSNADGLSQSDVARAIGVHRSVINRELRGQKDITLGRVAELAKALGYHPVFRLEPIVASTGSNLPLPQIKQATSNEVVLPMEMPSLSITAKAA